jgi:ATP-dependent Lon protease
MDSMHYAHEKTKEVILEYLAILNRKNQLQDQDYISPVLAFVGVQGAGKTSLAKAIATSLGRPFYRISMGALGSGKELRGSPPESESGEPGQIIQSLANCGSMNPVILLDEFDKLSGSSEVRSDFMAILLEILDPQQNTNFRDHYIDYPVDLSKILFIATANKLSTVSRELLDRLEVIKFEDYNKQEKIVIAQKYLYPQVLEYAGLQQQEFQITSNAWPIIIDIFGQDPGVRRLERNLQRISRKAIKQIILGQTQTVTITPEVAQQYADEALPSIENIKNLDYTAGKQISRVKEEKQLNQNSGNENAQPNQTSQQQSATLQQSPPSAQ